MLVLDFGGQYSQLIARRVREARVYSELVSHRATAAQIARRNPSALILSGGPASVYAEGAPHCDPAIFELGVPILGICYGMQLLVHELGGRVEQAEVGEFGRSDLQVSEPGVLLRGIQRADIQRGQVIAAPRSIRPRQTFQGQVFVLSKDEGGRHTPIFGGYKPQFFFRTTDVTGTMNLPEGVEMVMPGDNIRITGELLQPIAMEEGLRFAVREGGRTVGAGVVTKIFE